MTAKRPAVKKALPRQTPPKEMAKKLVRALRPQHPDYQYLKKVFQHTRELLRVRPGKVEKRLPELLTDDELGVVLRSRLARAPTRPYGDD